MKLAIQEVQNGTLRSGTRRCRRPEEIMNYIQVDTENHETTVSQKNISDASLLADTINFSKQQKKDSVEITFENITYTVNLGFKKVLGRKKILHGINGRFLPGQMIAIIGPSGAGKSTLLDILSGYRITGVDGTVYINGHVRVLNSFKKMSCYIMQEEKLQPLLTVIENMRVAANLKLSVNMNLMEKDKTIEDILKTLSLYEHQNTQTRHLSGGQKKRLSIALELINNPLLMFFDEPTTGLDSSSCGQCIKLLKLLAQQGRTIICTIHQPSASLFQLFDQVYVLAAGKCLYQGTTFNLVPYLEKVNMPCQKYHNPADYIIEIACGEYGQDKIKILIDAMANGKCLDWFETTTQQIDDLKTLRLKYPLSKVKENQTGGMETTSECNQIKVLIKRGILIVKRDFALTYLQILVYVFIGVLLSALYYNTGNDGSQIFYNYNLLFYVLLQQMLISKMLTILTFPSQISILQKELFNRWYSLRSYYISVTVVHIPMSMFCCFLLSITVYTMTGQPMTMIRFGMFFTMSLFIVFVAQSIGLMIGAVFNITNGAFVGPTLAVPFMMFSGFSVSVPNLPKYLYWGSYISYLRYGLDGVIAAVYGENRPLLDCKEAYCHYRYPEKFLSEINISGTKFWDDVLWLSVMLLSTRVAAFCLLHWKLNALR